MGTFDGRRLTAHQRGYTHRWRVERAAYLIANPKCLFCPSRATVVDHKYPHRGDMTIFWDRKNWQPLCSKCHCSMKQSIECSTS